MIDAVEHNFEDDDNDGVLNIPDLNNDADNDNDNDGLNNSVEL